MTTAVRIERCVVGGGGGEVGLLFVSHLARDGVDITVVDTAPALPESIRDSVSCHVKSDIAEPTVRVAEAIRHADLVLLTVPERVGLAAVKPVGTLMRRGALWADTLSVKGRIVAQLQGTLRDEIEAVSLNPMFAPSLGMAGRSIAAVLCHDGPRARTLLSMLGQWGARVVPISATEHDRVAAATQAATHAGIIAFGLALRDLGLDLSQLLAFAPPPHHLLLALLARIASAPADVYWDVQASNPGAATARAALCRGAAAIADVADGGDHAAFSHILEELSAFLGSHRADLAALCARVFETMPAQPFFDLSPDASI